MSDKDVLDFNAEQVSLQMADLLESFENHPLMQPPDTHPTLFFLFDFIRNTHKQLKSIDPSKLGQGDGGDADTRNTVAEVVGRNQFAKTLIEDTSGKLALLTGGDPGRPVDFGEEIREKARFLG